MNSRNCAKAWAKRLLQRVKSNWLNSLFLILAFLVPGVAYGSGECVWKSVCDSSEVRPVAVDVRVEMMGGYAVTRMTYAVQNDLGMDCEGRLCFFPMEGSRLLGYGVGKHRAVALPVAPLVLEAGKVGYPMAAELAGRPEVVGGEVVPVRVAAGGRVEVWVEWAHRVPLVEGGFRLEVPAGLLKGDTLGLEILASHQAFAPEHRVEGLDLPPFKRFQDDYILKTKLIGAEAEGPLRVFLPLGLEEWTSFWEAEAGRPAAFAMQTIVPAEVHRRKPSKDITLFWDVSLSGAWRDHGAEVAVLRGYLAEASHVKVRLMPFAERVFPAQTYEIKDGDVAALAADLLSLAYDGASCLGCLPWGEVKEGEVLLVSDGDGNWGEAGGVVAGVPVYAFHGTKAVDRRWLEGVCAGSGGHYAGAVEVVEETVAKLLQSRLKVLRVRYPRGRVSDVFVEQDGDVGTILGRMRGHGAKLRVDYGYGRQVSLRKKYGLQYQKFQDQTPDVGRRWAQALVDGAEEVDNEVMGWVKAYELPSRWTSLDLLEAPEEYVAAGRVPPGVKGAERDSLLVLGEECLAYLDTLALRGRRARVQNLVDAWGDQLAWYKQGSVVVKAVPMAKDTVDLGAHWHVRGQVVDARDGLALSGARVRVGDAGDSTRSDRLGVFRLEAGAAEMEVWACADGYFGKTVAAQAQRPVLISLVPMGPASRLRQALPYFQVARLGVPDGPWGHGGWGFVVDGVVQDSFPAEALRDAQDIVYYEGSWARFLLGEVAEQGYVSVVTKEGAKKGWQSDGLIQLVPWDSAMRYLDTLEAGGAEWAFGRYLEARETYGHMPAFFLDVGDWYLRQGDTLNAVGAWSNVVELAPGHGPLYRSLGQRLIRVGEVEAAVGVLRRAMVLSPDEPQAMRDLALALAWVGEGQEAKELLVEAIHADWSGVQDYFGGIETVLLGDLQGLMGKEGMAGLEPGLREAMPVDLRITAEWNRMEMDVDLWVVDRSGERCDYRHPETEAGGLLTRDFADGYGPEEFLLRTAGEGVYEVGIDYYGEDQANVVGIGMAKLTVYVDYGRATMQSRSFWVDFKDVKGTVPVVKMSWKKGLVKFD